MYIRLSAWKPLEKYTDVPYPGHEIWLVDLAGLINEDGQEYWIAIQHCTSEEQARDFIKQLQMAEVKEENRPRHKILRDQPETHY